MRCDPWPKATRNPPEIVILDVRVTDYDATANGNLQQLESTVRVYVSASTIEAAQRKLDPIVSATGTKSVRAAIKSDRRLGGFAYDCRVVSCETGRTDGADGVQYVVADFSLAIVASI